METEDSAARRKKRKRRGVEQTLLTVKIDNDIYAQLREQPNKNRFINDAIRERLAVGGG